MSDTEAAPRPGSSQDLSRRMDRMEQNHEALAREVTSLAGTVARVEMNQVHAAELNKLRFDALDSAVKANTEQLVTFISRVESILSGEAETNQMRQGREMVSEWQKWREGVNTDLDKAREFEAQARLVGRVAVVLVSSNLLALIGVVAALLGLVPKG